MQTKTREATVIRLASPNNGNWFILECHDNGETILLTHREISPEYRAVGLKVEISYFAERSHGYWQVTGELMTGR